MTVHLPVQPPHEMTLAAKAYLLAGASRNALIGVFALRWPEQFTSGVFVPIVDFIGLPAWGWSLVTTGLILFAGAVLRHRDVARIGLIASVFVSAFMALGLWGGAIDIWASGGKTAPISAVLLATLVVKDSAVCGNPMRLPLDVRGWTRAREA